MIKGLNAEFESGLKSDREEFFIESSLGHIGWLASQKLKAAKKPSTWGATTSIVVAFLFVVGFTFIISDVMAKVEWYGKTQNAWWVESVITNDSAFDKEYSETEYQQNYLVKPIILSLKEAVNKTLGIHTARAATLTQEKWYGTLRSQTHREINIDPGRAITIEARFTNNGTYTWFNTGEAYVSLVSKRNSDMEHDFWYSTIEPAKLSEISVKPEGDGLFRFALQAPSIPGIYTETFNIYAGNVKMSGETVTISLNVGGITHESSQVSSNENLVELQEMIIDGSAGDSDTPLETSDEVLTGQAPETQDTTSEEVNEILEEGNITLFEGDVFEEEGIVETSIPVVYEEPGIYVNNITMVEPYIRVGLYEMNDFLIVAAPLSYRIASTEDPIGVLIKGEIRSAVSFDPVSKKYLASAGAISVFSDRIRFIPENLDTKITLLNFHNPVKWDPTLNDNRFRGVIEITFSEKTNSSWVINELPIEDYLKGLTETSEISPLEYHKSIVVAARSYALWQMNDGTRHLGKPFDVDAKIDQVYRGYNSEIRLPTFVQATEETEGVVVTYDGEIALTTYFAQSDGRTRSYREVWKGPDKPYLQSVSDKTNEGLRLFGHGVGMSARGALIQASRFGKSYDLILHHYYTDIELMRVYNDGEVPIVIEEETNENNTE